MIEAGQRGPAFERANVKCPVARSVKIELRPVRVPRLALQLLFCFEVRSLSERLVSSTPE